MAICLLVSNNVSAKNIFTTAPETPGIPFLPSPTSQPNGKLNAFQHHHSLGQKIPKKGGREKVQKKKRSRKTT